MTLRHFFRDDKGNHIELAKRLVSRTRCVVAVPNYRLSGGEPLHHPEHAKDVLQFLSFVLTRTGLEDQEVDGTPIMYDASRIYLIGHSCATHMLTSIFLDSSAVTPELTPSPSLLRSVRGIIMTEGIYDLDLLLSSFPSYRTWFVEDAFGERASYSEISAIRWPLWNEGAHVRWLVVHSPRDSLVDPRQSEAIFDHLTQLYTAAHLPLSSHVLKNMDTLQWEHDRILLRPEFVNIVGEFVVISST